jgi:hypothetical protein
MSNVGMLIIHERSIESSDEESHIPDIPIS